MMVVRQTVLSLSALFFLSVVPFKLKVPIYRQCSRPADERGRFDLAYYFELIPRYYPRLT